ncbi:hypothetical protein [Vibrio sp. 10N.261.51.F12]|uniref:hypothetical protein n=1 Tax=Vibrio sp. 10N.261.51.F12 TaxID=3229679 RepID=UPI00354DA163
MKGNTPAPVHAINIDFSHSSEARELMNIVRTRLNWLSPCSPEFKFLHPIYDQLVADAELLESLEG